MGTGHVDRLRIYLGDERHIYKGSHQRRRRAALADLELIADDLARLKTDFEHVKDAAEDYRSQATRLRKDEKRLDWLDSIRPIGCWDGWVEAGEQSHAVTVWINAEEGETNVVRQAIDTAESEWGRGTT